MTRPVAEPRPSGLYRRVGKRLLDLALGVPLLVLMSPVMAVVALLVAVRLGRPVLFRQSRPGLGGRPFTVLKFRTMREARDAAGHELPDAQRLTPLGRALRQWSLDELPELWNILRGEMSLVGPRPLKMKYRDLYTREQARREEVPPGLTGWSQVNGRNALTWEEKFELDLWYVDHVSAALDLKILLSTPSAVLSRRGISAPGHATMPDLDAGPDRRRAPDPDPPKTAGEA